MRSTWTLRAVMLALIASVAATPAAAQQSTTRGFNIGAHLQGASLKVEDDDPSGGGGLGLRVGYGFNRRLTGYLEADGIAFDVENPDLEGEWTMAHVDLGLRFNFANSLRRWVPFLDAAIGARAVSVEDATSDGEDVGKVTFSGGSFSLGGGISFFTSEKFALETLVKFTGGTFEQVDVGSVSVRDLDIDASSFRFKLGMSWWP
ncbi:MAG TPA: outer membrane beta-barrel protein [Longimicrobiales bacterium]|nr:outer membrane beta-barrel protein [Longimicrobiales bacterium]